MEIIDLTISAILVVLGILALTTWKTQKRFEIDVDALVRSREVSAILNELRTDYFDEEYVLHKYPEISQELNDLNKDAFKSFVHLHTYKQKYLSLENEINELRKQAFLVLNYSKDKDLRDFYQTYLTLEYEIACVHHNYHIQELNSFISRNNYDKIEMQKIQDIEFLKRAFLNNPGISEKDASVVIYKSVFGNEGTKLIDKMREKHLSFYFRKGR